MDERKQDCEDESVADLKDEQSYRKKRKKVVDNTDDVLPFLILFKARIKVQHPNSKAIPYLFLERDRDRGRDY